MIARVDNQPYQAEVETFGSRAAWKKWEEWEEGGSWVRFMGAASVKTQGKPPILFVEAVVGRLKPGKPEG